MIQIILAALSFLGAVAVAVTWYFKGRGTDEALKQEKALNAEVLQHQSKVRLSIVEAEKAEQEGHHVTDAILNDKLSRDELNRLRSGHLPSNSK